MKNQQNHNRMMELIAELDKRFTPVEIEIAFVNRQIDNELAAIGALDIGADKPEKVLAFRGYEIIKKIPYLAV